MLHGCSNVGSMGAVPEADNNTPAQPAAPVHPFFMSRSAKRTQTQTATGDTTAKRSKPAVVEKRGRKPNSLAQPKPGKKKQQTLLGLKPAAKDTAPEQQIDKAETDTSNDDGPASVPAVKPKPFVSINSEADLRKLDRMAARAQDGSNDGLDDDDDDDDFMPTPKPRRRGRAAGNDKELNDILAWANSDGTLSSVREKRRAVWRSGSDTEPETFSNIILLEGPSGSCKTAAVYACADDLGFQVHEIHPGQKRSGKDILSALEDLIQSHTISAPSNLPYYSQPGASSAGSNTMSTENQMLILIEQVDVLFEQDQRMWPALKQLAHKSRRPIVLTCTDTSCVRWGASNFHSVLSFRRPTEDILVPYCFLLCLIEGALVSPAELSQ
ncbi:hypothetical protein EC988_003812, partial [Linderina pennispora]